MRKYALIIILLIIFSFNICGQDLRYFQVRDKLNPMRFFNEIDEYELFDYDYYYKVFYDFNGNIIKFEYYYKDVLKILGEYTWLTDSYVQYILSKIDTNPNSGKEIKTKLYKYYIYFKDDKIDYYEIFKFSAGTNQAIKMGKAKISYPSGSQEVVENYYNGQMIARIVLYFKDDNLMARKEYDANGKQKKLLYYKNNRVYKYKKYYYNLNGELYKINTYDASGKLIESEDK